MYKTNKEISKEKKIEIKVASLPQLYIYGVLNFFHVNV